MNIKSIYVIVGLIVLLITSSCSNVTEIPDFSELEHPVSYDKQYSHKHIERLFYDYNVGKWNMGIATNTLAYTVNSDNSLDFEINIEGRNGHSCWMKASAKKVDDYYLHKEEFNKHDREFQCHLTINMNGEMIEVIDKDYACTYKYCGSAARIGSITFTKEEKLPECIASHKNLAIGYSVYTCDDNKNIIIEVTKKEKKRRFLLNRTLSDRHRDGDDLLSIAKPMVAGSVRRTIHRWHMIEVTRSLPESMFR